RLFGDGAFPRRRRRTPEDVPARIDDAVDDVRRYPLAAVRDRRDGIHDLQRCDADLLADRHRRIRQRRPLFGAPHQSRRLAGELDAGALAETESVDVVVETARTDAEADANRADVRRM